MNSNAVTGRANSQRQFNGRRRRQPITSFEQCHAAALETWGANAHLSFAFPDFQTFLQNFLIAYDGMNKTNLDAGIKLLIEEARLVDDAKAKMRVARCPLGDESISVTDVFGDRLVIWIYGPIGGRSVTAEAIAESLAQHPDARGIYLRIDCGGGEITQARTIAHALSRHRAKKIAIVDKACWSAAAYIMCAADRVVIRRDATIMLHRAVCSFRGNEIEFHCRAYDLRSADQEYQRYIAIRRGIEFELLRDIWTAEGFIPAHEAVAIGLADEVIDELPSPVPLTGV